VADTGIGIPQDQMQLIFEEFFQVDYSLSRSTGGAGLAWRLPAFIGRIMGNCTSRPRGCRLNFTFYTTNCHALTEHSQLVHKPIEMTGKPCGW